MSIKNSLLVSEQQLENAINAVKSEASTTYVKVSKMNDGSINPKFGNIEGNTLKLGNVILTDEQLLALLELLPSSET